MPLFLALTIFPLTCWLLSVSHVWCMHTMELDKNDCQRVNGEIMIPPSFQVPVYKFFYANYMNFEVKLQNDMQILHKLNLLREQVFKKHESSAKLNNLFLKAWLKAVIWNTDTVYLKNLFPQNSSLAKPSKIALGNSFVVICLSTTGQ